MSSVSGTSAPVPVPAPSSKGVPLSKLPREFARLFERLYPNKACNLTNPVSLNRLNS